MNFKSPVFLPLLGILALAGCAQSPINNILHSGSKTTEIQPIVYEEPKVSAPFYALNPTNYELPPEFEVHLVRAAQSPVLPMRVKNPDSATEVILDQNRLIIPLLDSRDKALKYAVLAQNNELDVTEIDDFLNILEGKARHYPVRFSEKRERNGMTQKLKSIISTLDGYALNPNASYDVLLRAAKANHMARNLDMGEIYGPKALSYILRLLKMKPKDPEVSFWLGFGLSEGGALQESIPYLKTAMEGGIQEAHLSMANTYLYLEQNKNAITTLNNYKIKYPSEAEKVDALIADIQAGQRYNVWQVKP